MRVTSSGAPDGAEELLFCEQHPGEIHLVLTDVVMPETGEAGYTDDAIGRHGALDPGSHFIGKPFARDELLEKVRGALDRGSPA